MYYVLIALISLAAGLVAGYIMGRTDGYSDALIAADEVIFGEDGMWDRVQRQTHGDL